VIVDRIGETLERWLIAQIITMFAVFSRNWIASRSSASRVPSFWASRPDCLASFRRRALIGGLIVVLASLASGWVAAASAFVLFLGVHALESYILTPILQRHALDIPQPRYSRSRSCWASCSASGAWRWRCR